MALTGSITVTSRWSQTPSNVPGGRPLQTNVTQVWSSTDGTATDQANRKYAKPLSLLVSTPMVLDLTSLTDFEGAALSFGRIKSVLIVNLSTTKPVLFGSLTTVTNAHTGIISNPGQLTIRPSTATSPGLFTWIAPDATGSVVDSTHKLFQLDPGAFSISVWVEIVGTT